MGLFCGPLGARGREGRVSEHAGGVRRLSYGGPESDLRPLMNEGSKALWDPSAATDS